MAAPVERHGRLWKWLDERVGLAEVEKLAQASQRPTPAVRRMMEKSGDLDGLRQGLRDRMTLELLVANANVKA